MVLILFALMVIPELLQKWLWMRQLNYSAIFWTLLSVKWGMTCVAFIAAFLFLWINIRQAARNSFALAEVSLPRQTRLLPTGSRMSSKYGGRDLSRCGDATRGIRRGWSCGVLRAWLLYAMGHVSPLPLRRLFRDVRPCLWSRRGVLLFRLPFYLLLQGSLVFLTVLAIAGVVSPHAYFTLMRMKRGRQIETWGNAAPHLSVLLFILTASFGWGYYLDRFDLLYSTMGVVYGVGYTADHVTMIALWVMIGVSAVACALLVLNFFRPRPRAMAIGVVVYGALYALGIMLVPALVQNFVVQPNELELETPYLKSYIEFTRKAYNLDAIQETSYPALEDLTPAVIARNQGTIQNIRLWDSRPLLQTYQQTQAIRLYYQFYNVDTDRYHLADGYHQVMLATRELSAELPAKAQTWVNENLQFTHGEGVVMNFVSKITPGGFPEFLIENIPPESSHGLNITQPAIYYGEATPGSRIVATGVKEFDYPKGNQNVYASYEGNGGIPLDSLGKRLLFAWTQADINILLTSYLKPESRIQIWRDVQQRVSQIAPSCDLTRILTPS